VGRGGFRFGVACAAVVCACCLLPASARGVDAALRPHGSLTSSVAGCPQCHADPAVLWDAAGDPAAGVAWPTDAACVRCHVTGRTGPTVYGGDLAAYRERRADAHGGAGGATCVDCHVVHGAALEGAGVDAEVPLRAMGYQDEALAAAGPSTSPHDLAVSVWCTGCHPRWPEPAPLRFSNGAVTAASWAARFTEHPMGPGEDGVGSCLACHAALGFPHVTPGHDAGLPVRGGRGSDAPCVGCHPGVGVEY